MKQRKQKHQESIEAYIVRSVILGMGWVISILIGWMVGIALLVVGNTVTGLC